VGRRLLERFQERVLGLVGEEIGGIDDDYTGAAFEGVEGDCSLDLADLVDSDGGLWLTLVVQFEGDRLNIGVQAVLDACTGCALEAGGDVRRVIGAQGRIMTRPYGAIAVQHLGEAEGERCFAYTLRTGEQVRVRRVITRQRTGDGADSALVTDQVPVPPVPPRANAVPTPPHGFLREDA
jgi:hypothetical protein